MSSIDPYRRTLRSSNLGCARTSVPLGREFLRHYIPGAEVCFLAASASCVGVRESRRIKGRYVLQDGHVRSGKRFSDVVLRGGFPIDSHDPKGASLDSAEHLPSGYDIPLSAMLPAKVEGLIIAGLCISAEHAHGHGPGGRHSCSARRA